MWVLAGLMIYIFLCGSILALATLPIWMHKKEMLVSVPFLKAKPERQNDPFNYLFDVYGK